MARERRETTAMSLILTGIALGVLTGILATNVGYGTDDKGILVLVIGGFISQAMLLTGCVAKGVEMGMRVGRD